MPATYRAGAFPRFSVEIMPLTEADGGTSRSAASLPHQSFVKRTITYFRHVESAAKLVAHKMTIAKNNQDQIDGRHAVS
jgi:hypothetical protein